MFNLSFLHHFDGKHCSSTAPLVFSLFVVQYNSIVNPAWLELMLSMFNPIEFQNKNDLYHENVKIFVLKTKYEFSVLRNRSQNLNIPSMNFCGSCISTTNCWSASAVDTYLAKRSMGFALPSWILTVDLNLAWLRWKESSCDSHSAK